MKMYYAEHAQKFGPKGSDEKEFDSPELAIEYWKEKWGDNLLCVYSESDEISPKFFTHYEKELKMYKQDEILQSLRRIEEILIRAFPKKCTCGQVIGEDEDFCRDCYQYQYENGLG